MSTSRGPGEPNRARRDSGGLRRTCAALGDDAHAAEYLERAIHDAKGVLPPEHDRVVAAMHDLVEVLPRLGRDADARALEAKLEQLGVGVRCPR